MTLLQNVIHERKYPWREEISCTRWMAQCVTCGGNLYRWEEEKTTATRDLEDHIEECEREKHNTGIMNLAKSYEASL